MLLGASLLTALAVGLVWAVAWLDGDTGDAVPEEPQATERPVDPAADPQLAVAFATYDESAVASGADQVMILAFDTVTGEGSVLLVPAATVADVPGHGLLPLGRAYGFGRAPLLDATLDNLLGINLDGAVGVSRQGWSSLFTRVGGFSLEVRERLTERREDGTSQVRFQAGEQFLDGPRLAEFLTFEQDEESQLDQLPRTQLVLTGLLRALAGDEEALEAVFGDGAPMLEGTVPVEDLRTLLAGLARAHAEDRMHIRTLPVSPIGSGDEASYRLDESRAQEIVSERLARSVPSGSVEEGRALQILNGNGTPGIGQHVAGLLLPEGFRVVSTGNADRFDHRETRIIIYSDDTAQIRLAERVQDLLGVGRIERSRQPLSVADITIVVGLDFLELREGR